MAIRCGTGILKSRNYHKEKTGANKVLTTNRGQGNSLKKPLIQRLLLFLGIFFLFDRGVRRLFHCFIKGHVQFYRYVVFTFFQGWRPVFFIRLHALKLGIFPFVTARAFSSTVKHPTNLTCIKIIDSGCVYNGCVLRN